MKPIQLHIDRNSIKLVKIKFGRFFSGLERNFSKVNYWELQLEVSDQNMVEVFNMQKEEANQLYSRFIDRNYEEIIQSDELLSHNLLKTELFPELKNQSYFLIVIDNLRYDQWLIIKPIVEDLFSY